MAQLQGKHGKATRPPQCDSVYRCGRWSPSHVAFSLYSHPLTKTMPIYKPKDPLVISSNEQEDAQGQGAANPVNPFAKQPASTSDKLAHNFMPTS